MRGVRNPRANAVGAGVFNDTTAAVGGPAFRSLSTADTGIGSKASLAIGKPTGTVNGDVLIAGLTSESTNTITSPPAGWTQLYRVASTGGPAGDYIAYWKVAASEGSSWTWTFTGNHYCTGTVMAITGGNASTPINASASTAATGFAATLVGPVLTTTVNGCLIVHLAHVGHGGPFSASPVSFPASTTIEGQDFTLNADGFDVGNAAGIDTANQVTAGATTARTISMSGGNSAMAVVGSVAVQS